MISDSQADDSLEHSFEGLSSNFADIVKSVYQHDGSHDISDAITFLRRDSRLIRYSLEDAILTHVKMVDIVFRDLLFPLTVTERFWTSSPGIIGAVLEETKTMLERIAGEGSMKSPPIKAWYSDGDDYASLIQHHILFSAMLAALTDDREEWEVNLGLIATSTEANICYLLSDEDSSILWEKRSPSTEGRVVSGCAMWAEPLVVLAKESVCLQMSYRRDVSRELLRALRHLATLDTRGESSRCAIVRSISDVMWSYVEMLKGCML